MVTRRSMRSRRRSSSADSNATRSSSWARHWPARAADAHRRPWERRPGSPTRPRCFDRNGSAHLKLRRSVLRCVRPLRDTAAVGDGTDRACVFTLGLCTSYAESRVYLGGSAANGCHRSDVAEVLSAQLPVARRINIACSGAVTTNLLRASSGGTTAHGELPQADQLLSVAQTHRVRMIVVSIGGNDLGFEPIVTACVTAYLARTAPCNETHAEALSDEKARGGGREDRARDRRDPRGHAPGRVRRRRLPTRPADLSRRGAACGRRPLRPRQPRTRRVRVPVLRRRSRLGPRRRRTHRQRRADGGRRAWRRDARHASRVRRP